MTFDVPAHDVAVRTLRALRAALRARGTLTLSGAWLDDMMGVTRFRPTPEVYLDDRLSDAEWLSTLLHELVHVKRGPVPRGLAATEEALVRHEAARTLLPDAPALAMLDRAWSSDDVYDLAARRGVDVLTVRDALDPPTVPIPAAIPVPRDPDNRWS